jgi:hypothetical protein
MLQVALITTVLYMSAVAYSFPSRRAMIDVKRLGETSPSSYGVGNELDELTLDVSTLSEKDRARLKFVAKLGDEADDLAQSAGLNVVDYDRMLAAEDDEVEKGVRDTQWSGQSGLDIAVASSNNWDDLAKRPLLALGDVAALVAFASVGQGNHGESSDLLGGLWTATPFVLSWLAATPFLGAYSREATASKGGVLLKLAPGWVVAVPLALAVRGALKGAVPPTPFIGVAMVTTLAFTSAWRLLYVSALGETSDEETRSAGFLEVFKMVGTLVKRW